MGRPVEPAACALALQWRDHFGAAMEAMADLRLVMHLDAEPQGAPGEMLWWKQDVDAAPGPTIWVGAPEETWSVLGERILQAAGLASSGPEERKSTFLEVVRQALGGLAQALSAQLGREVICRDGSEEVPAETAGIECRLSLAIGDRSLPALALILSPELLEILPKPSSSDESPMSSVKDGEEPNSDEDLLSARACGTLSLLLDVELPVSVSFGRTQVRVQDALKLSTGSIIELDRSISEPVEVIVNNCVIARGEVVVVEGNYGVRIREVMSRLERLKQSRKYLLPLRSARQ